jgi:hypothetical protein
MNQELLNKNYNCIRIFYYRLYDYSNSYYLCEALKGANDKGLPIKQDSNLAKLLLLAFALLLMRGVLAYLHPVDVMLL